MTAGFTLHARLEHLTIVSWAVPADRLQAMLPKPLVPQTIDDRGEWALVSMAMMLNTTGDDTYAQLNERAYVMRPDGGGKGAFFWRSHASTWQASMFRSLLGIPEYTADLRLDVQGDDLVCEFDGQQVAKLRLGSGTAPKRHAKNAGFSVARAIDVSSNPMIGYTLNWGELCATRVVHDDIDAREVFIERVDPRFMVPAVAIDPDRLELPLTAVYQRETPFHIGLPPTPVAGGSYLRVWSNLLWPTSP